MKRQRTLQTILVLSAFVIAAGCDSDPIDPDPPIPQTHSVFVGNQGAPASITAINPEDSTTTEHFRNQMSGFLQGMALMNDRLYVTGNANSINIVDPETREVVDQIVDDAFGTARYLAQVSANRAYVTTQTYDTEAEEAEVVVINLANDAVVDHIGVPVSSPDGESVSGNPDGIAVSNGKAFVAQGSFSASTDVGVIDVANHTYSHAVNVECAVRYLIVDNDGEVIGSCSDTQEIVVIDPDTEDVTRVDAGGEIGSLFGVGQDAVLARLEDEETVYFLSSNLGVIAFDPDAHSITGTIDVDTANAGAIGFDPQAGTLYIGHADPNGHFSANGSVTVHELDGSEVASYEAGIYPVFISVYAAPELVALR